MQWNLRKANKILAFAHKIVVERIQYLQLTEQIMYFYLGRSHRLKLLLLHLKSMLSTSPDPIFQIKTITDQFKSYAQTMLRADLKTYLR